MQNLLEAFSLGFGVIIPFVTCQGVTGTRVSPPDVMSYYALYWKRFRALFTQELVDLTSMAFTLCQHQNKDDVKCGTTRSRSFICSFINQFSSVLCTFELLLITLTSSRRWEEPHYHCIHILLYCCFAICLILFLQSFYYKFG